ncbi:High-affinity branched-chain amino acid transport system permease protein LivH [Sporomusa silvacetica DSM 10669]|uniref:High-affinity branched-chain amino acid transport system permease protein LivH n=1 Tax=Sporomusa silvacetica DSM 10669 TaxID=1123289 RepID=A0ABZ3IIW8_9FIRM|nr:branched-chain amino acid ABC transporter permease [Sporomusa silvacetica]OZC18408.1 high-affinity branched-chain amino acid transport system permease protein LivH [Sporomusa silvacetica DSM 10669]
MFFQQLINGITVGGSYALIALGYTMVYGILKIVNFAHGDVFMIGSFLGLFCMQVLGMPYMVAFPVAAIATAVMGIFIERVAYRPIRVADSLAVMISALGVSIFLENLAMVLWGTGTHAFSGLSGITITTYEFHKVILSNIQIGVIVLSILLMIGLYFIVNKTKIGVAMRATSHSIKSAKLMGINTDRIISFTFGIGSALACIAGMLVGIYYDAVYPLIGYSYGLKAFAAAVLGGIGSIPGAMLGGFVMGIVETLGASYISTGYRDAFAFAILIIVLIFRPAGILGKKEIDKV